MSDPTVKVDPRALLPGTRIRHRSGSDAVLHVRKSDDSGWWLLETGGLADSAWDLGEWSVVTHVHCDSDPIECSVEALQGEYAEVKRQRDMYRQALLDLVALVDELDARRAHSEDDGSGRNPGLCVSALGARSST